jgi:hypothetical protein
MTDFEKAPTDPDSEDCLHEMSMSNELLERLRQLDIPLEPPELSEEAKARIFENIKRKIGEDCSGAENLSSKKPHEILAEIDALGLSEEDIQVVLDEIEANKSQIVDEDFPLPRLPEPSDIVDKDFPTFR